jgi:hypothetical protein
MDMKKFLQAADPTYNNPILSTQLTASDRLSLTANTAKRYAIPTGTDLILFTPSKDIWVLFGGSDVEVEVPDEYDVVDGSAPLLNPGLICNVSFSTQLTHVSLISEQDCQVSIQRWSRR